MSKIDFSKTAKVLNIRQKNGSLIFNFFNQQVTFSKDNILNTGDHSFTDMIKDVLYQYLSNCPDQIFDDSHNFVTLREFSNSGPLYSRFTANTYKIIETTFSGHLDNFVKQSLTLGGTIMDNVSYDVSIRFQALSKIPIILNFNDIDDMMPANAVFLFNDNANKYLDLKGLSVLCTYLTGQLIQQT
jgi:hypothetical protein